MNLGDMLTLQRRCQSLADVQLDHDDKTASNLAQANFMLDLLTLHRKISEHMDRVHVASGRHR